MAWSTIRTVTTDEVYAIANAAVRFQKRHGVNPNTEEMTAEQTRLWLKTFRRITGEPAAEGIAYGMIGFGVK